MVSSNYNILFLIVLVLFSSCVSSQTISPNNLFFNYSDASDGQTNVFPQNFPVAQATFGYTYVLDCQNNRVAALRLFQNSDLNNVVTGQNIFITPRNVLNDENVRCFALHDERIGEFSFRNFITAELCEIRHIATRNIRENNENSYRPKSFMGLMDDEEVASRSEESTGFYIANIRMSDGICHPAIAIQFA